MNTLQKTLVIAAAAFCFNASVSANEDHGPGGHGMHTPPTLEQVQAHFAQRLAKLHTKLNLQAGQEAAWTAFVTAMTPTSLPIHPNPDDTASLSAPERAQKMLDGLKQHETVATAHVAAIKTFYAALSAEQQKTFDDNFHKMRGHGPRHG